MDLSGDDDIFSGVEIADIKGNGGGSNIAVVRTVVEMDACLGVGAGEPRDLKPHLEVILEETMNVLGQAATVLPL